LRTFGASWVVPVGAPPLREGRVAVADGRIAWLGREGDPGQPGGPETHLGTGVILPGLINAHCHLELSYLAEAVDGSRGFVAWVESLIEKRGRATESEVRAGVRRGISQLESTGTVAVGDVSNVLAHLDLLEASSLTAVVFYELLGWDPRRAEPILGAADRVLAMAQHPGMRTRLRLAAHAPHSVSSALMEGLRARGGPAAIHLAESAEESRFLDSGNGEWAAFLKRRGAWDTGFRPPRTSPVRYVDSLGILGPGLLAAHCVHVDEGDREILARRRAHVAVCPRSNRTLRVGIPPVPHLLEAGVRLCLGTDSLASAPTLDLLEDMAVLRREFPDLPPAAIVHMGTAGGAAALGLDDLGTLAPGQKAALAFAPAASDPDDPLALLVSGEAQASLVAL